MKEKHHTCLLLTAFSGMARPVGKDSKTSESVANAESKVHEIGNLCVGGNGCILMPQLQIQLVPAYLYIPHSITFPSYVIGLCDSLGRRCAQRSVPRPWLHTSDCRVLHTLFPTSLTKSRLVTQILILRSCQSLYPNAKLRVQVCASSYIEHSNL